jgi:ATP-binding cassette subfamily F protein 3
LQKTERAIETQEAHIEALDAALADPQQFQELSRNPDYYQSYERDKQKLEVLMTDWESLTEQLEHTQAKLNKLQ